MLKKLLRRSVVFSALLLSGTAAFAQLGVVVAASGANTASSALLLASASAAIKTCGFESRQSVFSDIDSRMKTAAEAIAQLERDAQRTARGDIKSALKDVRTQEGALKENLESATKATEVEWPTQRELLASSYTVYTGAVARLEAAVSGSAAK